MIGQLKERLGESEKTGVFYGTRNIEEDCKVQSFLIVLGFLHWRQNAFRDALRGYDCWVLGYRAGRRGEGEEVE